ncbi:MAG TPA: succinate dehydrogenase assembly factor 2 [Maritimibacter sp.]|nr:succinate dehydrogenase assembly factor 2 [Maritimibacter sp.]
MIETTDPRLKRLSMRSWRRGIKEMDIILGHYSDDRLVGLDEETLTLYDALLSENDQDLYQWVSGQASPPQRFAGLISEIADHTATRRH